MASKIIQNLIRYIVSEVQDADFEIYRTRLVKLLYLCDVEYFQSKRQLLTELNWVRYKYGPYAFELQEITHRMGLELAEEEVDFSSGHGFRYEVLDFPEPEKWLDASQKHIIDKVIKHWGGENLDVLLDYVYCDTEPMKNAQFRQALDFRGIPRGIRHSETDTLEIDPIKRDEIKSSIEKHGIYSEEPVVYKVSDKGNNLGGDETTIPPIAGHIKFSDTHNIIIFEGRE
jgi:hypothetical protein